MPGRTRSAQPTASPWNIVIAITRSARSASARTFGSAAASSPETNSSPIGSGLVLLAVAGRGPGVGDAAPVRRRGQVEGAAAGLAARARAAAASAASVRAALAAGARPDQDRALRVAQPLRRARRRAASLRQPRAAVPGGVCASPGGPIVTTSAPLRARGADPEVDDRRALDDRLVADDDDQLGVARSPTAAARNASSASARLLGQHRGVRAEPGAHAASPSAYACSTVSEPESAVTTRPLAPRAAAARPRRARRPSETALEARGAGRAAAGRRSGRAA